MKDINEISDKEIRDTAETLSQKTTRLDNRDANIKARCIKGGLSDKYIGNFSGEEGISSLAKLLQEEYYEDVIAFVGKIFTDSVSSKPLLVIIDGGVEHYDNMNRRTLFGGEFLWQSVRKRELEKELAGEVCMGIHSKTINGSKMYAGLGKKSEYDDWRRQELINELTHIPVLFITDFDINNLPEVKEANIILNQILESRKDIDKTTIISLKQQRGIKEPSVDEIGSDLCYVLNKELKTDSDKLTANSIYIRIK